MVSSSEAFPRRRIAWVLVAIGLATSPAVAESRSQVVQVQTAFATDGAHPGSTAKAAVVVQISPGFHINDHKPTLDYLIPTELKLEPVKQVSVAKLVYPKGELKRFAFSDTQLSVYEGTLAVGALLKIAPTARPGTYTVKGSLAYQACNDHACLPPTSVPVKLAVKVFSRGTPLKRGNEDVFSSIGFD